MISPHNITEDFMPRKRKSDQPTQETEPTSTTAVVEPAAGEHTEERPNFVDRLGERSNHAAMPDPFEIAGDYLAGVRLFESKRDRQMAIKFDEKPGQPVIDKLKDSGYRWNPADQIWVHPVHRESAMGTRIDAERLYQEVRQMVRQDKGIETGQEVPL